MFLQQAQQFRQNSESVPSPASPGSEAVRSPDSVASHGDSMNFALSPGSHSALNNQFNDQVKMVSAGKLMLMHDTIYIKYRAESKSVILMHVMFYLAFTNIH